jgi:ribonuclease E
MSDQENLAGTFEGDLTTAPASSETTAASPDSSTQESAQAAAKKTTAKKTAAKKTTAKKAAAKKTTAKKAAAKKTTAKKTTAKKAAESSSEGSGPEEAAPVEPSGEQPKRTRKPTKKASATEASASPAIAPLFQAPESVPATAASAESEKAGTTEKTGKTAQSPKSTKSTKSPRSTESEKSSAGDGASSADDESGEDNGETGTGARRRRRRGGRRRRKGAGDTTDARDDESDDEDTENGGAGESASSHRRRRRVRAGDSSGNATSGDPENTVTRVRKGRSAEDEITGFSGSTRLEAKKQRRREGREAGRRRAPIISEAEFLARRESVDRAMVVRQRGDLTQIAVLEDKVLVEHYVARESQTSLIGNVYLGRVQNVLPSMEAAFVDIGRGRNAVLYAGEVNWDNFGVKDAKDRRIEDVLKSGQSVLVQVTKDPIGHKGARLTSQISLPGRFLVYVPDGTTSGISRKLPDSERSRLKALLKEIVPDTAGVIVRTAAEGASEDELTHDVARLKARWEDVESKSTSDKSPQLLYSEPDLTLKVVRDLFTEDFGTLTVEGEEAWAMVKEYVEHVAPDLTDRLKRHDADGKDVFAAHRIDEQIAKALERKVWLPSGGSLIIDRTEAMTVVDVNTGKFTGSGGNLEETVTKNNLEAAEEIVRQLRLRDIGGIIVIDFIDMVLENNRDLVLRRLVECLGRDRTRHQVAEVTSLGLVQMTRKRIGTGLLEAFSENCEVCAGRGLIVHHEPVESQRKPEEEPRKSTSSRRGRSRGKAAEVAKVPSPADVAAMAQQHHEDDEAPSEELDSEDSLDPLAVVAIDPSSDETDEPDEPDETDEIDTEDLPERDGDSSVNFDVTALEPFDQDARPVVTSVRRTAARRAAGPPVAVLAAPVDVTEKDGAEDAFDDGHNGPEESQDAVAHDGAVSGGAGESEDADSSVEVTVHVPIKKKGARKR